MNGIFFTEIDVSSMTRELFHQMVKRSAPVD
jgi:hypothetical protein